MSQREIINKQRTRRRNRVRQRVQGTSERPRLTVFRSLRHISAQVIDDDTGRTLAAASTEQKEIGGSLKSTRTIAAAEAIGKAIAERAKSAGVSKVAFDRGHYRYHGRIAALAKAARDGGLAF